MSKPTLLVMSRAIATMARPPSEDYDILVLDEAEDREALLRARGAGIRAVLCAGMERLDAARLSLLPDLELIAAIAAGYGGVDVEAAAARGIAVTNAGGLNSGDVADYAVALMLAHRRDLIANDRYVRDDRWPGGRLPPGRSIARDRVGIVGLGHIGVAVAERLAPFGCAIAWWGPRAKPDAPWRRTIVPSPALLFRYSALTFNSHRIHYDLPYARDIEGYPGLVVHGPLMATLLLDLADRELGPNRLAQFAFRGVAPAFAGEPITLSGERDSAGLSLLVRNAAGGTVMSATATIG